jgi:hypothetical protein
MSHLVRRPVHTKDYHYIGGFYGASNEPLMMREILANGPIAVSFEVRADRLCVAARRADDVRHRCILTSTHTRAAYTTTQLRHAAPAMSLAPDAN